MARGQIAKETVTSKILDTFDGSFIYGKEIRVPIMENGEIIQIKVVLTAAKENVKSGADTAIPGTITKTVTSIQDNQVGSANAGPVELTEAEKDNIAFLEQKLKEFGM